jgi:hypothetical protein
MSSMSVDAMRADCARVRRTASGLGGAAVAAFHASSLPSCTALPSSSSSQPECPFSLWCWSCGAGAAAADAAAAAAAAGPPRLREAAGSGAGSGRPRRLPPPPLAMLPGGPCYGVSRCQRRRRASSWCHVPPVSTHTLCVHVFALVSAQKQALRRATPQACVVNACPTPAACRLVPSCPLAQ